MHNDLHRTASHAAPADFALARATVTGVAGAWFFIDGAPQDRALRAESCLLAPEVGDLVLVNAGAAVQIVSSPGPAQAATLLGAAPFILADRKSVV